MRTIYNKDGKEKQVESVDAREHVATGRWFYDPPKPEEKHKPEEKQPAQEKNK